MKENQLGIATFNILGLSKTFKQEQLSRDMKRYGVKICAIQESKIKAGIDQVVGKEKSRLITFKSNNGAYGNGFMVSSSVAKRIYKCLEN